jgi:hypothetical protein
MDLAYQTCRPGAEGSSSEGGVGDVVGHCARNLHSTEGLGTTAGRRTAASAAALAQSHGVGIVRSRSWLSKVCLDRGPIWMKTR